MNKSRILTTSTFDIKDGLIVAQIGDVTESAKIAAFDMDWTLIKTKTGKTFPRNVSDW